VALDHSPTQCSSAERSKEGKTSPIFFYLNIFTFMYDNFMSATESYMKPGDQHDPTLDALAEDLAQGARAQVQ